jgi:glyoxylase-like metal-dependent hydrolase (beta-lactamase superfamily II)
MSVRQHYKFEEVEGLKVGRVNQGINTNFIVYRIGDTVIDSGPSNQWRHVKRFLTQTKVSQLLLTHHHEDHSGNAYKIGKWFNIQPKAPKLGQEKLMNGYKTPLLQKIVWGSMLPVETVHLKAEEFLSDGSKVIPVHTPGHTKDLTCFFIPSKKYFFSGDLYIAPKLKLLRSDENLEQLLNSINKVLTLDFKTLFCPHGGVIENGKEALTKKRNYILNLIEKTNHLATQGMSISDIVIKLLGPEDIVSKLTQGNFCKENLIVQCIGLDSSKWKAPPFNGGV